MSKKNSKKQIQARKVSKKTQKPSISVKKTITVGSDFYPLPGTAFVKEGRVFIVEDQELLSVFSEEGDVSCFSLEEGSADFTKWIEAVSSNAVQVIWCPKQGRVTDNSEYLNQV